MTYDIPTIKAILHRLPAALSVVEVPPKKEFVKNYRRKGKRTRRDEGVPSYCRRAVGRAARVPRAETAQIELLTVLCDITEAINCLHFHEREFLLQRYLHGWEQMVVAANFSRSLDWAKHMDGRLVSKLETILEGGLFDWPQEIGRESVTSLIGRMEHLAHRF